jgi:dihydrodipicolinate synthase/N-acetylneuraminate lyase
MSLSTPELLEALNSVISVPIVPFKGDQIDYEGHAKNIRYLVRNNYLEGGRPRVIAIAGTSLVHHISREDQLRLIDFTGQEMGRKGVLIAGIVPNPIGDAGRLIESMSRLSRPPDAYLVMPLSGVINPEGIHQYYTEFGRRYGEGHGARFFYYLRQKAEREAVVRLLNGSPHFLGVKVGTGEDDVAPIIDAVQPGCGMVIWGIGDRSTRAARAGARGHTSGINVVYVRASDEINNAQRRGDHQRSQRLEDELAALEEIRFREGRIYNYSAVVEAMHLGGFDDVAGGTGGPFNPRVPPPIAAQIQTAISGLNAYH